MENNQSEERSEKGFWWGFWRPPQGMCNPSLHFLKDLRKGEILHLRDDFRPYMRSRYWVFVDLFKSGGVFLHREDEGFLQVKVKDIDWEEFRKKKQ